jgi:hypothetical protein
MGDTPNWLSLLLCYPVISLRVTGYLRLGQVGGDVANPAINPQCLLVDTCPCVVIWGSFYCWLSTWMILVTCLALFIDWCWFFFPGKAHAWGGLLNHPFATMPYPNTSHVCLCLLMFACVHTCSWPIFRSSWTIYVSKKKHVSAHKPPWNPKIIYSHCIGIIRYPINIQNIWIIAKIVGIEIYPPVMKRRDGKCPT